MINYKIIKRGLIFLMTLIILLICTEARLIKANAEGWVKVNNSWRYYSDSDIKTGWYKFNGNWYYMEEDGSVKTGWIKSEGKYYYLDFNTGKMVTGWIRDKGKWYYLNNSGIMVRDIYIGEYYLGPDGIWENRN